MQELSKNNIMLLRKTKSFNKSRYSRNRQYYRTGVFLCLWANIILVLGAYYLFFRLTIKFTYFVLPLLLTLSLVMVSYFSRNLIVGPCKVILNFMQLLSLRVIILLYTITLILSNSNNYLYETWSNLYYRLFSIVRVYKGKKGSYKRAIIFRFLKIIRYKFKKKKKA